MYYPATLNPHGDGRYDVTFADLPGCVSQGDSLEDALRKGEEALTLHIRGMLKSGEQLPRPSTLAEARAADIAEAVMENDPLPEGVIWQYLLARLPEKEAPPVRLSISLKPAVVERIDRMAADMGLTRSGLIAVAAAEYVGNHP